MATNPTIQDLEKRIKELENVLTAQNMKSINDLQSTLEGYLSKNISSNVVCRPQPVSKKLILQLQHLDKCCEDNKKLSHDIKDLKESVSVIISELIRRTPLNISQSYCPNCHKC